MVTTAVRAPVRPATRLTLAACEFALALVPLVVGAPLGGRRLQPLAHARSTGTRIIVTTHAHQRHERG
jgi:hypothetical protein